MIIRIKKQEQDVDIESKDLSMDHEEIVLVLCLYYTLIKKLSGSHIHICYFRLSVFIESFYSFIH